MPWELEPRPPPPRALLSSNPPTPACLPQALTKWGGALLELAHFRQGNEAYEMIEEVRHPSRLRCVTGAAGWPAS